MGAMISAQSVDTRALAGGLGRRSVPLLSGQIAGVQPSYHWAPREERWAVLPASALWRIVFFVGGSATLATDAQRIDVTEMGVLCLPPNRGVTIEAMGSDIEALALEWSGGGGLPESRHRTADTPLFKPYSRCPTYRETIKSERTVNRTILAEGVVPRFCMGSVQTTGPDVVRPHRHPMLEQFFFGLPGNRCTVEADGERTVLGERTLLHIPLGSVHGATVEEGATLHYLWMDFFQSDDLSYIAAAHRPAGNP